MSSESGTPAATSRLALTGPADQQFADRVLESLDTFLAETVSDADRFRFMLAVSEVVTNVVKHGGGEAEVDIEFTLSPVNLSAHISDTARPADIDWETVRMPDESAESGRGLSLVLAVLDEFLHDASARGNTWRLHLRLEDSAD